MFKDIALVLEGGGMRGAYTAGVLDALFDEGFKFGGYAGTSAGATHLCNYLSEQRERNLRLDTIHSKDSRYMSLWNWIRTGNYFDLKFCYHTVPEVIDPFDFDTFKKNAAESEFYVAASNVVTGGAEHFRVLDLRTDMDAIRASSSLALVSSLVKYKGKSYQKEPNALLPLYKLVYGKYPNFVKAVGNRYKRYNKCLKTLAARESAGDFFVFRPSVNMKISRVEKNTAKLQALYALGLKDARERMEELCRWLKI